MMKRIVMALLGLLLAATLFARTISPEVGTGYFRPIWLEHPDFDQIDFPRGGPGLSLAIWWSPNPRISMGLYGMTVQYDHSFPKNIEDYSPRLLDAYGRVVGTSLRLFNPRWSDSRWKPFLAGGVDYHHLTWTQRYVTYSHDSTGDVRHVTTRFPILDQGGLTAGVGVLKGDRAGRHWVFGLEYEFTVIRRDHRADYAGLKIEYGF